MSHQQFESRLISSMIMGFLPLASKKSFINDLPSLKLTDPRKMDGWKMKCPFPACFQGRTVNEFVSASVKPFPEAWNFPKKTTNPHLAQEVSYVGALPGIAVWGEVQEGPPPHFFETPCSLITVVLILGIWKSPEVKQQKPLKTYRNPKGKDRLLTIIFQGRAAKLPGSIFQTFSRHSICLFLLSFFYLHLPLKLPSIDGE